MAKGAKRVSDMMRKEYCVYYHFCGQGMALHLHWTAFVIWNENTERGYIPLAWMIYDHDNLFNSIRAPLNIHILAAQSCLRI